MYIKQQKTLMRENVPARMNNTTQMAHVACISWSEQKFWLKFQIMIFIWWDFKSIFAFFR